MYNMLIVDDEKFAVHGISRAIDWSDLPINEIFEAYSIRDVEEIVTVSRIHLLIVDIEMPGADGFEVMKLVRESNPDSETIFLTAHANFDYAQKAIQMGSFDYLLKPFDHQSLKRIVQDAIGKVEEQVEQSGFIQQYHRYLNLWEKQCPVLIERFWQDLLHGRTLPTEGHLEYAAALYQLPVRADNLVIPVLISLESWNRELSTREEAIMEFALGNIATEIFSESSSGEIVKMPNGHVGIVHVEDPDRDEVERMRLLCEKLIEACQHYLQCSLTCYVGKVVTVRHMALSYKQLTEMERLNINSSSSVLFEGEDNPIDSGFASVKWPDIRVLMEIGKKDDLNRKMKQIFKDMEVGLITSETLEAFYFNLTNLVFHILHEKNISVHSIFSAKEIMDGPTATASIAKMKLWSEMIIDKFMCAMDAADNVHSAIVEKVCAYIRGHLSSDIARDDLAAVVHLNPTYLSRLFKKEKGTSMSDYILKEKMNRAKELLSSTNLKVSTIAEEVGYGQYTYFSKLFRRFVGVTPQEYRKSYQSL